MEGAQSLQFPQIIGIINIESEKSEKTKGHDLREKEYYILNEHLGDEPRTATDIGELMGTLGGDSNVYLQDSKEVAGVE